MKLYEIILIAISLSMDALGVSMCKGISFNKKSIKNSIIVGLYFGIFQALMPVIGYFLGSTLNDIIDKFDHYIIFIILTIIGINMIKESNEDENVNSSINFKTMLPLAIATSIDALAVGITFSFSNVNLLVACFIIGIITFVLCTIGTYLGIYLKKILGNKCEILGGIVLIIMGLKILLTHLGII